MIDFFAGMGNFRAGFEQAGFECVYSVEWDKNKRRIYEVIYGNEPNGADIKQLRGSDLPDALVWCFGAPCQDFSIGGLREGMDGSRSSLVREIFRLIREREREKRNLPEWLVYENVKGMLSSNNGWDFAFILSEMDNCGYDAQWQTFNSKDFKGTPQNRERIYTIGHFRERGFKQVRLESRAKNKASVNQKYKIKSHRNNPNNYRVYSVNGVAPCLTACGGGGRMAFVEIGNRIRKLTPREYMRLQGVADETTDKLIQAKISDAQMYRAAGDAVTVSVVYEVAQRIRETIKGEKK